MSINSLDAAAPATTENEAPFLFPRRLKIQPQPLKQTGLLMNRKVNPQPNRVNPLIRYL